MKMRKTLATMMSGIIAMSPAGVIFAAEAVETPVTYGDMISLSLTQGGETLSADITAVYNESGDSSFSVSVTLPASMMGTEEPVVYGFDDVLRVCGEDVYLNVEEATNYSRKLLENYNINRKIYAISNGIDTNFFKYDEKLGKKFRKEYDYSNKDKIIIGIGLYIERKGIVDFVELAKRMPDYKFIWFGYSPLSAATKPVKKAVKTELPNLKFAGYVEKEMIKAAMCGTDLYLFPTLEETEGIPIIEAFACKTNTLVRDIPIFDEFEDGKIVYKAKTLNEFEDKIKKIIDGELPSLVDNAYKIAEDRDVKKVGKELVSVYKGLLK